jgi:hypothetical protein
MTVNKDEFYVGGYFPKHGKIEEMSITKFDGKFWTKVGKEGTNGHVYCMLVLDHK